MKTSSLLREDYQPVLIGNTRDARRLARKVFRRFGTVCYLCDKRPSLSSLFGRAICCQGLSGSEFPDLLADELLYLASFDPFCVYIAGPCREEYKKALRAAEDKLSGAYIFKRQDELIPALAEYEKALKNTD